ncbi:MAG TPA: glycosyl hydrolase [Bryobacteraceae bacterium]|nr:glycosyl hydrolase [Bryobacteraceae bacterium]
MTKLHAAAALTISICIISNVAARQDASRVDNLKRSFLHPPDDARIMMRWWWFGPAVAKPELDRELHAMKDAGIGGVEIQPVYPLQLDDVRAPARTAPYLSPEFLDALKDAVNTARDLSLRVDITLGSGWPYGGPHTPVAQAAGQLRVEQVNVPEGAHTIALPAMENGETLIGAFIGGEQIRNTNAGRIAIPVGLSGSDLLYFFIASRTGQQVKRSAVGAEGFVLNHYSRAAIEDHLALVGDSLLRAFGEHPPYAVFSDSLEVYGSDWTDDFPAEFQKRRHYDLLPFLPALVRDIGANTRAIRHDWGKTLTELTEENYLAPIREWARAHHTLFRSQTYGEPPVILSSNRYVDLPEGEHGPYWRRFSAARWASSASHLYGRPVTSTETWTWLHSPAFRATPLDLKAEADRHFIEGINQLIGHGWPYSPPSQPEPGWSFYAAAALNDHNPWFDVMPSLAAYLQRVSFLLRQGQPANDVAIYLPTDDAWARLQPGKVAVDEMTDELLGPVLIPAVLNGGYNFDFIDDRAIAAVGIPYKLLILPGIERIPLATIQRLQAYAQRGGLLVATRTLPSLGAGLLEEKSETARIGELSREIFQTGSENVRFVASDQNVASALKDLLPPDFATGEAAAPSIGFVHRKLPFGEIYFVANASNRALETAASVRVSGLQPEWWDPFIGTSIPAHYDTANGRTNLPLALAPYESKVLVFATPGAHPVAPSRAIRPVSVVDLGSDWKLTFLETGNSVTMPHLRSWTEDEATRFYSGRALYEKTVPLPASFFAQSPRIVLDFGPGTPIEPAAGETPGMQALLDSPVREAAVVVVNGKRAGVVWHPPYQLDIAAYVHSGENQLQITVGNLAINQMSGHAPPDYRLLNLRYGVRFSPQDMQNLKPLPSGILHAITLRAE